MYMDSGMDAQPAAVVDAQSSEIEQVPETVENAEIDDILPDSNIINDRFDVGEERAIDSNSPPAGDSGPSASVLLADNSAVSLSQAKNGGGQPHFGELIEPDLPDSGQSAETQPDSGELENQPSESAEPERSQVTTEAVADDGEIVSDSEFADESANGAPDEADSTTACEVAVTQSLEPQVAAPQKRQHDDDSGTNDDGGEPQTKKTALEHLRSMKFSKNDPFNDSANSLRFNREDADAHTHRKRPSTDEERDRRRNRYRHGVSPSSHVSSSTDNGNGNGGVADQQKRQRSTMYFLMQGGEQPPTSQSLAHAFHHHHNLPAALKGVLQTSGHLRQKLESLLSLKDDQVFGLATEDMECLLMYTFELSMEQDRLLAGRKAQLKQLDQMIQKERDHMERLVQELPSHARPNIAEMFNGKSPNAAPMKPPVISISAAGSSGANAPPPSMNFSMPPPGFSSDPIKSIGGPPAPGQFVQPPLSVVPTAGGRELSNTQPPPSDFSKPPPTLPVHSLADNNPLPPGSFSAPPLALVHTSSEAMTAPSSITVNTSLPPPKIVTMQQPAVTATASIVSSTVGPLGNFSAPPPPTDFSKPPPATAKSPADISHSSSPTITAGQTPFMPAADSPIFKITSSLISSSNITAALDLSVPPPSLMMNAPLDAGSKTKSFHNLNQPPPKIVTPTSMHQISQSILSSVAPSLKQHTPQLGAHLSPQRGPAELSAPRPLMSINQQRPLTNFRPPPSAIPSLASISRTSVTIKRPTKAKNQGGRPVKKNLRKAMKKIENQKVVSQPIGSSKAATSSEPATDSIESAIPETVVKEVVTTELLAASEADSSSELVPMDTIVESVAVTGAHQSTELALLQAATADISPESDP